MKSFVLMFVAAFAAFALALFGYDHFVVQPRAFVQAQAVTAAAQLDLSAARTQANEITAGLDAAIKQTMTDVDTALASQTSDQETRRLIADAFMRANVFKAVVSESYATEQRWPESAKQVGLANPKEYAGEAVTSIVLGANGVITITLDERLGTNAKLSLIPKANAQTMQMVWRCAGTNFPTLTRYQPVCSTE